MRGRTDVPEARRPVRRPAATDARIRSWRVSHRRQAIPDRLSFWRHEAESLFKLSVRPLVSWWLRRGRGGDLRLSALSAVFPDERICDHLCDLWAALCFLCALCLCGQSLSCRAAKRSIRARVDPSWCDSSASPFVTRFFVSPRILPARTLPSSTPHWSKLLTRHTTP